MKIGKFSQSKIFPALCVFCFFCAYIFVGNLIYKDYGISVDEKIDFLRGKVNYERFIGGPQSEFIKTCSGWENVCYYPPLFSMVLYWYAPGGDSQTIYWRRHQLTFAFFVFSVFIFFLIGKKIFKDWKIGLLGALFLIISPRIFAHSFYNPKDIPFLSAYIIAIYTLLLLLEKKNIFTAVLHGIAMGVVCSIRTPGLIIFPITFLFYFFDLYLVRDQWKNNLKSGLVLLTAFIIAAGLIVWFTPVLYTHPIENFIYSFNLMKQYPWNDIQFYMGKNIGNQIPWHYSMVWFSISSPVLYLLLFIFGTLTLVSRTFKVRLREHFRCMRDFYLVAACGVLPILAVIMMKSIIYTDNRQMYFVYPALLLISLYGFTALVDKIRRKTQSWRIWMAIIVIVGLAYPVYFMIRYHPYQYTYFNFLAGSKMSVIKERFGLDTWGVSTVDGLKYIARTDAGQKINVRVLDFYGGKMVLPIADRQRLIITESQPPDYIITTYYYPIYGRITGTAVYSIKVGDADILTVYKMTGN